MNFFEKLIEKSLQRSSLIEKLATSVAAIANELYKISLSVSDLASAVQDHNAMISDLYDKNDLIIKILKKESTELSLELPNEKDKPKKPN